jgi:hypothetical protein
MVTEARAPASEPDLAANDPDLLGRWLALTGLIASADEMVARRTGAWASLGLAAADTVSESVLGLLASTGAAPLSDRETWEQVLNLAVDALRADSRELPRGLRQRLLRGHRLRNMALHLGTEPAPGEVARAVATAKELMEFAASGSATLQTLAGTGPLRAVGQLVGIADIADALTAADEALQAEKFTEAADKAAVALELAFRRMEPPLLPEHRSRVNFSLRVQEFQDLDKFLDSIDRHVNRVEEWMLAVATGFRPAELRELRLLLGHVIFYSGGNIEVRRGESVELSPSAVHRAALQVAGVIFRLWQTGSLKPDRRRGDLA